MSIAIAAAMTLSFLQAPSAASAVPSQSAQPGVARRSVAPNAAVARRTISTGLQLSAGCNLVDFDDLPDSVPVGTVLGMPTVTFGQDWLTLVDSDVGGIGNFANEPSASTVAYAPSSGGTIDLSSGVAHVDLHYSAAQSAIPVLVVAYDGPNGTGNVVASATGTTLGTWYDGAACSGDPTGDFCSWDSLVLSAPTSSILSLTISGSNGNYFAIDSLTFCTAEPVVTYCTAKTNSLGCIPAIGSVGLPSASSSSPFDLRASNVINNKSGLLFYGLQPAAMPFQDGTLCVQPPIRRTHVQFSGGNAPPNDCSGHYSIDFNAYIQSGVDPALVVGQGVYAQYWARDPAAASTTSLSNAATFTIE